MTGPPQPAVEDPVAAPLAELLLAYYSVEIRRVADPPRIVSMRPGDQVEPLLSTTTDECCLGLAWVRVADIYPSSEDFPNQDASPMVKGVAGWAVELEMGAARCAPTVDARSIPTGEQWNATSVAVLDDVAAMRRAVCCLVKERGWRKVLPGRMQPLRTEGGCVGATMSVLVWAPACDCVERQGT